MHSSSQQVIKTPLNNLEVIEDGSSLLVASRSSLIKIELDSCTSYRTCRQCMDKSPQCGWCGGQCTTASQCSSWPTSLGGPASSAVDVCVDVVRIQPERKFKRDNEWIEVEFGRDLATYVAAADNATFECVFRLALHASPPDEMRTDAVKIAPTKLKCALPHSSKIKFR